MKDYVRNCLVNQIKKGEIDKSKVEVLKIYKFKKNRNEK